MASRVIEGTWEEIKLHEAELIGRQLRVTIKSEKTLTRKPSVAVTRREQIDQPKKLVGFGAFKGKIGSSEEFAKEKRAEIELEERNL